MRLCVSQVWTSFDAARWCGVRDSAHEKLYKLLQDPIPEVTSLIWPRTRGDLTYLTPYQRSPHLFDPIPEVTSLIWPYTRGHLTYLTPIPEVTSLIWPHTRGHLTYLTPYQRSPHLFDPIPEVTSLSHSPYGDTVHIIRPLLWCTYLHLKLLPSLNAKL